MKKVKKFWGLYILIPFFMAGLIGFFMFHKGEAELIFNKHYNVLFDFFFRYYTYLGDGLAFVFLILLFLYNRYYYVIVTGGVIILQTIVVQGMKLELFRHVDRPSLFFSHVHGIHYVEGVTLHLYQSFPSGHSATAFSVATLLALTYKDKRLSVIWYAAAILVAISRVYLMQHFFVDVYFGAIIGIGITLIVWYLFENSGLPQKPSLNRSLWDDRRK